MRIANNIIIIAQVVSLAAYAVGWQQRGTRPTNNSEFSVWSSEGEEMSSDGGSKWYSHRRSSERGDMSGEGRNKWSLRDLAEQEGMEIDCCPSVLEMIEPIAGKTPDGMAVFLYRVGEYKQRFYELSCRKDVINKPCRFVDRKLHNLQLQSRCVQKYSYSYAIINQTIGDEVKSHHHQFQSFSPSGTGWSLDYIQVRSGCSCEVKPRTKRKRTSNNKGKRGKSRRESDEETQ